MSLPYFPMFPSDFEAKTSHLTLEEDGAYNRLLRICWMTPGCSLPDDHAWIARRMRVDQETFARAVKPVLDEFFQREKGRVFQPKLRKIFEETAEAHERRVEAGKKGGRKPKSLKNNDTDESNAKPLPKQPEPEPEPEPKVIGGGGSAGARDPAKPISFKDRILLTIGVDPSEPRGLGSDADMLEARRWCADLKLTPAEVLAVIAETMGRKIDGPPNRFSYFTAPMQRFAGAKAAASQVLNPLQPTASGRAAPPPKVDVAAILAKIRAEREAGSHDPSE